MSNVILFLLALPFSTDCRSLGDPDYRTREAADRRLKEAGWLAWPALLTADPENAEADARRTVLLAGLTNWPYRVALRVADSGVCPLAVYRSSPATAREVCRLIDEVGGWETTDSWDWVCRTPYRTGTVEGDFALVLTTYRNGFRRPESAVGK